MRFFKVANGKLEHVPCREGAHEVLLTIEELEGLERRLKNKTEEAERWRKRATGQGGAWKITRRIFRKNRYYAWILNISVPLSHSPELFEEVQRIVEKYFGEYMTKSRDYQLQHTPGAGWLLSLFLSEEEYNLLQMPDWPV